MNWALILIISMTGLMVGSFLNVFVYRVPIILHRRWRQQSMEFLQIEPRNTEDTSINLFWPLSFCPNCKKTIKPWHNIPLFSYLWLRRKCNQCQNKISPIYPLIEFCTLIMTLITTVTLGISFTGITAVFFTWAMIAGFFIDLQTGLLPDILTLPLLWLGLLVNLFNQFNSLENAVLGASFGYLFLWAINIIFYFMSGKEGMGYGDFKFFAALGAWLGWDHLPLVLLLATFSGSFISIGQMIFKGRQYHKPIAFGPYLALSGWICLLWGHDIMAYYTNMIENFW